MYKCWFLVQHSFLIKTEHAVIDTMYVHHLTSPAPRLSRPRLNFTGESKWTRLFLLLVFLLLWELNMLCLLSLWMSKPPQLIHHQRAIHLRPPHRAAVFTVSGVVPAVGPVSHCVSVLQDKDAMKQLSFVTVWFDKGPPRGVYDPQSVLHHSHGVPAL